MCWIVAVSYTSRWSVVTLLVGLLRLRGCTICNATGRCYTTGATVTVTVMWLCDFLVALELSSLPVGFAATLLFTTPELTENPNGEEDNSCCLMKFSVFVRQCVSGITN